MTRRVRENPNQLSFFDNPQDEKKEVLSKKELKQRAEKIAKELKLKNVFKDGKLFLEHPLLKKEVFEARPYTLSMTAEALNNNFLLFLDTGLGKTYIEILTSLLYLRENSEKKILLLAPVKVLCDQHTKVFSEKYLEDKVDEIVSVTNIPTGLITGDIKEEERLKIWQENSLIIATPQTIVLELGKDSGVGKKEDLSFVIFDEVHNLSGEYAYTELSKYYRQGNVFLGGFTASLPSEPKRLEKLMKSLKVSWRNIILRLPNDPELKAYKFEAQEIVRFVDREKSLLHQKLKKLLVEQLNFYTKRLIVCLDESRIHFDYQKSFYLNKEEQIAGIVVKEFKRIKQRIDKYLQDLEANETYKLLINWSLVMLVSQAIDSLNNGVEILANFVESQYYSKNKKHTTKIFLKLFRTKELISILYVNGFWSKKDLADNKGLREYLDQAKKINYFEDDNPKLKILEELISTFSKKTNVIIFFESRKILMKAMTFLKKKFSHMTIQELKGQTYKYNDPGMNIKKQQDVARRGRNREINVLLSTSVAEQGLDSKSVDVVILSQPISDRRRVVQASGRTSRYRVGKVYFLVYKTGAERKIWNIYLQKKKKVLQIAQSIIKIKGHIA